MEANKSRLAPYLIILLGLVGLGVSAYLSIKQITGTEIGTCPIFGGGCSDVLHSTYSRFLGIPLAYYGVLFYTLITICAALWRFGHKQQFRDLTAYLALIGFIDSAIFIYIQGFLIGAFCFYCVVSAVTATLLFFVMLPRLIDKAMDLTSPAEL